MVTDVAAPRPRSVTIPDAANLVPLAFPIIQHNFRAAGLDAGMIATEGLPVRLRARAAGHTAAVSLAKAAGQRRPGAVAGAACVSSAP